jgi:hypothetical protein
MSETAAQVATFTPNDGLWHEGLVGRPLPGHEIRIGDDGRIRIRGPQVMFGYLDGGGLDAEGWLTTGDLGAIDGDGRLTVLGRDDDMLISGGRNIHPQEIESCLAACPGVVDVAVTGLPDPVWGDLVVALVVGRIDHADLLDHARRHFSHRSMVQTLSQSAYLNGKNLFAPFVERCALWNKRMRCKATGEAQLLAVHQSGLNACSRSDAQIGTVGGKSGVHAAFRAQSLHINFADGKLFAQRKAFACCQQTAVFINQSVAAKDNIGARLAESAGSVYVACQAAGRLLADE